VFTCSREDFHINTYAFDCEALLLAGNNASADYSVKHYKGKFNAYQRTYVLTLKDTNNAYPYARIALEHQLTELKRFSKGTNTKYLTMTIFDDQKIRVPPASIQNRFAAQVQAIELLRAHHSISLASMNRLFFSLQNRAFRGEL
jgi:type I restriction enzyme S subunit